MYVPSVTTTSFTDAPAAVLNVYDEMHSMIPTFAQSQQLITDYNFTFNASPVFDGYYLSSSYLALQSAMTSQGLLGMYSASHNGYIYTLQYAKNGTTGISIINESNYGLVGTILNKPSLFDVSSYIPVYLAIGNSGTMYVIYENFTGPVSSEIPSTIIASAISPQVAQSVISTGNDYNLQNSDYTYVILNQSNAGKVGFVADAALDEKYGKYLYILSGSNATAANSTGTLYIVNFTGATPSVYNIVTVANEQPNGAIALYPNNDSAYITASNFLVGFSTIPSQSETITNIIQVPTSYNLTGIAITGNGTYAYTDDASGALFRANLLTDNVTQLTLNSSSFKVYGKLSLTPDNKYLYSESGYVNLTSLDFFSMSIHPPPAAIPVCSNITNSYFIGPDYNASFSFSSPWADSYNYSVYETAYNYPITISKIQGSQGSLNWGISFLSGSSQYSYSGTFFPLIENTSRTSVFPASINTSGINANYLLRPNFTYSEPIYTASLHSPYAYHVIYPLSATTLSNKNNGYFIGWNSISFSSFKGYLLNSTVSTGFAYVKSADPNNDSPKYPFSSAWYNRANSSDIFSTIFTYSPSLDVFEQNFSGYYILESSKNLNTIHVLTNVTSSIWSYVENNFGIMNPVANLSYSLISAGSANNNTYLYAYLDFYPGYFSAQTYYNAVAHATTIINGSDGGMCVQHYYSSSSCENIQNDLLSVLPALQKDATLYTDNNNTGLSGYYQITIAPSGSISSLQKLNLFNDSINPTAFIVDPNGGYAYAIAGPPPALYPSELYKISLNNAVVTKLPFPSFLNSTSPQEGCNMAGLSPNDTYLYLECTYGFFNKYNQQNTVAQTGAGYDLITNTLTSYSLNPFTADLTYFVFPMPETSDGKFLYGKGGQSNYEYSMYDITHGKAAVSVIATLPGSIYGGSMTESINNPKV